MFNEIWLYALRTELRAKGAYKISFSPCKFCIRSTLHKEKTEFNLQYLGFSQGY
jgi:hypothetical protein